MNTIHIQDNFTFCYYDRDHLGNVRQVREVNGGSDGRVIQTLNYYPFGAQLCDGTTDSNVQNHKYNGKEFDGMHGLNTYDYGARQYNPITARWDRVDPMAEKYYSVSPYVYCAGNPISYVDPDGRDSVYYQECGNELLRIPCKNSYNFVIKTTQTTEEMYADSNPVQKGKSNPITKEEALNTAQKISEGNINGEHMGNVVQIHSDEAMSSMLQSIKDDGSGGSSKKNNREYSGDFTTNGVRNVKEGPAGNPASGMVAVTRGDPDYHSHPSGSVPVRGNSHAFWQQPPSKQDIKTARGTRYVVGAGNGIIYIHDNKGVKATIPSYLFK